MRAALRRLALCVALLAAGAAAAQDGLSPVPGGSAPPAAASGPANTLRPGTTQAGPAPGETLDYAAWERLAARAEAIVAGGLATGVLLEQLRAQVADWRAAFLAAQGSNAARLATLRGQIAALGPAPAEGATEAPEIAARRAELNDQLTRLQAPVIAADEAYSRADGLIREIDRSLRERQADEFLKLWPMPVNPANWPDAVDLLQSTAAALAREVASNWSDPRARAEFTSNLPLILFLLAFALAAIWRGRRWFERLPNRLQARASGRGREVWAVLASLGLIVVPTLGVYALARALSATAMTGPLSGVLVETLTPAGLAVFLARWLALRVFPKGGEDEQQLALTPEERREGRFQAGVMGVLIAVESLRGAVMDPLRVPQSATSVLAFPIFVLMALALYRLGQLLRRHQAAATPAGEASSYRNRLIGLLGSAAAVIAVASVALAAVGYVAAGAGLLIPAVVSLALIAVLSILQTLIGDVFALLSGNDDSQREALIPVLLGFLLTLAALPLFALIWGARWSDIAEVFGSLRQGFAIGETRISPTSFLTFALVFAAGYLATRLFQGALRAQILPRTRLDLGGRNAVAAGTGYLGIFLAALIAINAAGIDLSGLAIVAGALSLGIGFGLQNIVQNFVSGIILLIERPVSEGDWIEVGGVQGIVQAISVRSTRIQTFDRSDVIVPNADLVSGRVTNWTRFNLSGRLIVPISVAQGSDTRKVERVLREIAEAQPMAILRPPPLVVFTGYGTDGPTFEIRVILRDVNASLAVRTEINHQIGERFAAEGIEMPFAQRDLWLRNAPEVAEALARALPRHTTESPA